MINKFEFIRGTFSLELLALKFFFKFTISILGTFLARLASISLLLWCKKCSSEGGLVSLSPHRNIWNINQRKWTLWSYGYQKMFLIRRCKKNWTLKFNGGLMRLRREKISIWRIITCPGGKRPSRPQKWSEILQIVQSIFAWVQEVCLLQTTWYMILHYKLSCKARLKNDKDLG